MVHKYSYDPIWNVIGKIEGTGDPSKCIIVGNHRDAWNFVGRDPARHAFRTRNAVVLQRLYLACTLISGSGSATLLEVARSFGALMKEGWRPYRTIMLASWDAEEQGLVRLCSSAIFFLNPIHALLEGVLLLLAH